MNFFFCAGSRLKDSARVPLEKLACFAEDDAAPRPVIEFGPKFLLERPDLPAENRLSYRQAKRRPRKSAGFRDRYEILKLPKFHLKFV